MIKSRKKQIYTVVEVFSGVAEAAYNFNHLKNAQMHLLKQLKKGRNLDEDDVQIFENYIID